MSNPLKNKTTLLGVTGSISAYKAADLASKLHQSGAQVDVVLTAGAEHFISPLTFQSVTGRKAYTDAELWGGQGHVTHIGLGHSADLLLIAPVTANTLAKLAYGIGDNLLTVTALAARCPLILAPAMDAGMYEHVATQASVEILKRRGATFVGPEAGHLASGLVGLGRFADPQAILGQARYLLGRAGPLVGQKVVVSAGGTQEPIDPVRYIANRSSGKQGYAIAQAALDAGADVILISAPTNLAAPTGAKLAPVQTAAEMLAAVLEYTVDADALIMAAAPADFTPAKVATEKIKKRAGAPSIQLEFAPDILAQVAQRKAQTGFPLRTIGFAAESQDLLQNAREKLERKQLDLIVANDIGAQNAGFEVETNQVTLLYASGEKQELPTMQKTEVAEALIEQVTEWLVTG